MDKLALPEWSDAEAEALKAEMTQFAQELVMLCLQYPQLVFDIGRLLLCLGGSPRSYILRKEKEGRQGP